MKAEDLRIGNYIRLPKTSISKEIDGEITSTGIKIQEEENCYKPIPLTEAWLLRFGFKKQTGIFIIKINNTILGFGLDGSYGLYNDRICFNRGISYSNNIRIKYLHQLQNLYHSLTGEELKEVKK